jgi:hypothetical protein
MASLTDWERNLIVSVLQRTAAMLGEEDAVAAACESPAT